MEMAARVAPGRLDTRGEPAAIPASERDRTLSVAATYLLSEDGRKASLLNGGDGRAVQQVTFPVPVSRLHLVTVDGNGVARLKLRPRFEFDAAQRIVRKDHLPTYDAPPSADKLLREAARNHQLEGAYRTERTEERAKRRELERELRAQVARAFLADPKRRALEQPTPTRNYCFLVADRGRHLRFDVTLDEGVSREVPPEAYRRFKADVRTRRGNRQQQRTNELAIHDQKIAFVAEWVDKHGTPDQKARHSAGVLPLGEVVQALADDTFAPLNDRPVYVRDGASRLQQYLRTLAPFADVVVTEPDLAVVSGNAETATTDQWNLVQEFRAIVPDGDVKLRFHRLMLKQRPDAPSLMVFGVRVTRKIGPFTLQREYAMRDDQLNEGTPDTRSLGFSDTATKEICMT